MGSENKTAEDRLRDFFDDAEATAGLKSIHGALVDMAQSGAGGTRSPASPEDKWYDARRGKVREHAQTKRALVALEPRHLAVLWAYYGTPGWPGAAPDTTAADAGLAYQTTAGTTVNRTGDRKQNWNRTEPPPEVRRELGAPLARVALLTEALAKATERWVAEGHSPRPPHGVLLALCRASGEVLAPVAAEATAWHEAALAAFGVAAGMPLTLARPRRSRTAGWAAPLPAPVRGVRV